MPALFENLGDTLKAKTGPVPNWVLALGGAAVVWWLLRPGEPKKAASTAQRAVTEASQSTFNRPGASGATGLPVQQPVVVMPPAGPSNPPQGEGVPCPGFPNCGTGPTPPPIQPPTQFGPTLSLPTQTMLLSPTAALAVSPTGVTAGVPVSVSVSGMTGADRAEVWSAAVHNPGDSAPRTGWHNWAGTNAPGFQTTIPTEDYSGFRGGKMFVAVELRKDGRVVATGNPHEPGFDPRLMQTVLLY